MREKLARMMWKSIINILMKSLMLERKEMTKEDYQALKTAILTDPVLIEFVRSILQGADKMLDPKNTYSASDLKSETLSRLPAVALNVIMTGVKFKPAPVKECEGSDCPVNEPDLKLLPKEEPHEPQFQG